MGPRAPLENADRPQLNAQHHRRSPRSFVGPDELLVSFILTIHALLTLAIALKSVSKIQRIQRLHAAFWY